MIGDQLEVLHNRSLIAEVEEDNLAARVEAVGHRADLVAGSRGLEQCLSAEVASGWLGVHVALEHRDRLDPGEHKYRTAGAPEGC